VDLNLMVTENGKISIRYPPIRYTSIRYPFFDEHRQTCGKNTFPNKHPASNLFLSSLRKCLQKISCFGCWELGQNMNQTFLPMFWCSDGGLTCSRYPKQLIFCKHFLKEERNKFDAGCLLGNVFLPQVWRCSSKKG
jgi:hypothetical protein